MTYVSFTAPSPNTVTHTISNSLEASRMDAKEARETVKNARHNTDGTVTLYPVPGLHFYPYPAQMTHAKPTEAVELLQTGAFSLHKSPDPPPEAADQQPEGPPKGGSSDSTEAAS